MPLTMNATKETRATCTRKSTGSQEGYSDAELLSRKIAKVEKLLRKCGRDDPDVAKWKKKRGQYIQQLGELAYGVAKNSLVLNKSRQSKVDSSDIMLSPTSVTTGKLDRSNFSALNDSIGSLFEYSDPGLSLTESDSNEESSNAKVSGDDSLPLQPCEWVAFEDSGKSSPLNYEDTRKKNSSTTPPTRTASILDPNYSTPSQISTMVSSASNKRTQRDSPSEQGGGSMNQLRALFDGSVTIDSSLEEDVEQGNKAKKLTKLRAMFDTNAEKEPIKVVDRHDGEAVKKLRAMFDSPGSKNKRTDKKNFRRSWNHASQEVSKPVSKEIQVPDLNFTKEIEDDEKSIEITADIDGELKTKLKRRSQMNFSAPAIFAAVSDDTKSAFASKQNFHAQKRVSESAIQCPSTNQDNNETINSSIHDVESKVVALIAQPNSCKNQLRALTILQANGFSESEVFCVDGTCPHQKSLRDELFAISGLRGVYPQLFVRNSVTEKLEFFGDFNKIECLNDCDQLKQELEKSISSF